MYQALYRKWRPKTFEDVVGQEHITETLKRQVADGRLSHAYLFTGTRGTGKTTCAKILAKAVNCEHPVNGNPCNCCPSCVGIESGGFLDVLELDAASNNGVEQIRALRDEAAYAPANVKKRVYIVDEVHMLTTSAFNALLKILEEPPEHLMFILATTELHKVPATILSRCQRFSFRRITPEEVQARLSYVAEQEGIDLRNDGAELLSRLADGALRDGLSLLDQCAAGGGVIDGKSVLEMLGLAGNLQTAQLMRYILAENAQSALLLLGDLYDGGKDMGAVLSGLSVLCRDILIRMTAPKGGEALLSGGYETAVLEEFSKQLTASRLISILNTLQAVSAGLLRSTNLRTDAELCILRLCDPSLCGDVTALTARIQRLENALKQGGFAPAPVPVPPVPYERPAPVRQEQAAAPAEKTGWDGPPPPSDDDDPGPSEDEPVYPVPPVQEHAPAPARVAAPQRETVRAVPRDNTPPPPPVRTMDHRWPEMLEQLKARLPMAKRAFLNMTAGRVEEGRLVVVCDNELVKNTLSKDEVVAVFRLVAQEILGQEVSVQIITEAQGAQSAAATAPKADPQPVQHREQVSAPPTTGNDPLENLLNKMQGFDNLKIH